MIIHKDKIMYSILKINSFLFKFIIFLYLYFSYFIVLKKSEKELLVNSLKEPLKHNSYNIL